MKASLFVLIAAAIIANTQAAHLAACTANKDGSGSYVEHPTRACCDNQGGYANINGYYDTEYGDCRTAVTGGNRVDEGYFVTCCSDLGYGSTAQ